MDVRVEARAGHAGVRQVGDGDGIALLSLTGRVGGGLYEDRKEGGLSRKDGRLRRDAGKGGTAR